MRWMSPKGHLPDDDEEEEGGEGAGGGGDADDVAGKREVALSRSTSLPAVKRGGAPAPGPARRARVGQPQSTSLPQLPQATGHPRSLAPPTPSLPMSGHALAARWLLPGNASTDEVLKVDSGYQLPAYLVGGVSKWLVLPQSHALHDDFGLTSTTSMRRLRDGRAQRKQEPPRLNRLHVLVGVERGMK